MKEKILTLLRSVKRPGIEGLIKFVSDSDFFTAPASTTFHSNAEGGLALHSYHVYELLAEKAKGYGLETLGESIILAGLCHDLCKTNFYVRGKKWAKDENNKWIEEDVWKVEDTIPLGHGEKSIYLLQKFIQLTDEEALAIRWHSGFSEAGTHFAYPTGFSFRQAIKICPLAVLLQTADFEATAILEKLSTD
jgi:hypothetical protein